MRVRLWLRPKVELVLENEPYAVVVPYSTRDVAPSLVVQVMVAFIAVILLAVMLDTTGAVVSGGVSVVKVLLPEVA